MIKLFGYIIVWILIRDTIALCALPDNLQNSVWVDSDKGDTTFNTTHARGFGIRIGTGQLYVDGWECFHNTTGTYANLILIALVTYQGVDANAYRPFLCLRLTAITQYSYYYYIHAPEQSNAFYDRVNVIPDSSVASITDPDVEVCQFVPADTADTEYHVLVKKGNENDAIQTCPTEYFGTYAYTVNDISTGTSSCGTGNERWDVCTDRQQMTFNYTLCVTPIAFSASGRVFCVVSLTSGSYVLHTVYNEDTTVDNTNTYRFTCFMSSLNADGSITTSMSPNSCTKTQTPNTQPTITNGTVVGLNVALSPIELCPITTTTTTTQSTVSSTGAIVGGTVGGIIFLALLALLLCLCLRFRLCAKLCKRKKDEQNEDNKTIKQNGANSYSDKNIKESEIKEHIDYCTHEGKLNKQNHGVENGLDMHSTKDEDHVHKSNDTDPIIKEAPVVIDIEHLPHVRHPHWIHGPRGEPPKGTTYQRNIKIGQAHRDTNGFKTDTSFYIKRDQRQEIESPETEISHSNMSHQMNGIIKYNQSQALSAHHLTNNEVCMSENHELQPTDEKSNRMNGEESKVLSELDKREITDLNLDANYMYNGVVIPRESNMNEKLKQNGNESQLLSDTSFSCDVPFSTEHLETILNLTEVIDRGATPELSTNRTTSKVSISSSRTLSVNQVDTSISSFVEVKSNESEKKPLSKSNDDYHEMKTNETNTELSVYPVDGCVHSSLAVSTAREKSTQSSKPGNLKKKVSVKSMNICTEMNADEADKEHSEILGVNSLDNCETSSLAFQTAREEPTQPSKPIHFKKRPLFESMNIQNKSETNTTRKTSLKEDKPVSTHSYINHAVKSEMSKNHNTLLKDEIPIKSPINVNKATKSVPFKDNVLEGENSFHGNALQILQKSASSLSLRNKTGTFIFENERERIQESISDSRSEKGIAYDDDCQYEMERGYTGIKEDVQENVDWKYGVIAHTGQSANTSGDNSSDEQSQNEADLTDNVDGEDETSVNNLNDIDESVDNQADNLENENILDGERVETAMSVFYTNSRDDPDQMFISYDGSLTPIVE